MKYEKGETNPTDYNSRYPLLLTREQKDHATEDVFFVNAIIDNDMTGCIDWKNGSRCDQPRWSAGRTQGLYHT